MTRRVKVFLPRWLQWFVTAMVLLMWGFMTYLTFAAPEGQEEMGVVEWIVVSIVLALVTAMIWLMSSGRLPAYVIELEDGDEPGLRD